MYTVILGAANSGKTCLFLEEMKNNIIISVVDIEKLFDNKDTLNKYSFEYFDIRKDHLDNISNHVHNSFAEYGKLNILIDEIHFFTKEEHLDLLTKLNDIGSDKFNLYYAIIPSSFQQTYKIDDDVSLLPNVGKILAKANNIIVVQALCKTCKLNQTVQSGIVKDCRLQPDGCVLVGKKFFYPQCVDCKSNI
jgi:thymidine kinase